MSGEETFLLDTNDPFYDAVTSQPETNNGDPENNNNSNNPPQEDPMTYGGKVQKLFEGHRNTINSISWSPDSTRFVTGSADRTARIWDVATATTGTLCGHSRAVNSVAWIQHMRGIYIATGGGDGKVFVWMAVTGKQHRTLQTNNNNSSVFSVAWCPNTLPIVAAGCRDGMIRIWDVTAAPNGTLIQTVQGYVDGATFEYVPFVSWTPNGSCFVSGCANGGLIVWHVETNHNQRIDTHRQHANFDEGDANQTLACSPDGSTILLTEGTRVSIWTFDNRQCIAILNHDNDVNSAAWSPDGSTIITNCNTDNKLLIWNVVTGNCVAVFEVPVTNGMSSILWSPDGTHLVGAGSDNTVYAFNLALAECSKPLPNGDLEQWKQRNEDGTPRQWTYNQDPYEGNKLAKSSSNEWVFFIENGEGRVQQDDDDDDDDDSRIFSLHQDGADHILSAAWHPILLTIVIGYESNCALIWNENNNQWNAASRLPQKSAVQSVAWSPDDGSWIITGSKDLSVQIWDATTHQCVRILIEPNPQVQNSQIPSCFVSWSGSTIFTKKDVMEHVVDHETRIWDASTLVDIYGKRIHPDFRSFPLSPLMVNDRIEFDSREATNNPNYNWPWFRMKQDMLRLTLETNMGQKKNGQNNVSDDERHGLHSLNTISWENPIHRVVRCGDQAVGLLRMFLTIAPFGAIQKRWAPYPYPYPYPQIASPTSNESLLMRALGYSRPACILLIFSVLTEFLTMMPENNFDDRNKFAKLTSMFVFKRNDCPELDIECRRHCVMKSSAGARSVNAGKLDFRVPVSQKPHERNF